MLPRSRGHRRPAVDQPPRAHLDWLRHRSRDRGIPAEVRITILVRAHNEEAALSVTLEALTRQTRQPDRVIVVADNCTDRTVEIALAYGAEAFETVDNIHKKGGALNQVLTRILPDAAAGDVILVMDADDFVDLDDDYGWDYGDEVIRTVGDCLDDFAPPGALRCRWSGSRVAMLAVGGGIDPDQLSEELVQQIRASGLALGKRPITVTCRVRGLTPEPGADLVQVAALMLESRPAEVESSGE